MRLTILILFTSLSAFGQAPNPTIGGGCDGCEIMYIGMPKTINAVDTSAGWHELGTKLVLSGKVFHRDGRTPASDVIVYYWHTDHEGLYSKRSGANLSTRHGHIRGWVKTGKDGSYRIYTNRPAAYPREQIPAHVHISIKEPNLPNEYYIDELNFDDDPLLYQAKKKGHVFENRGGSGILRVAVKNNIQFAEHNIILGLNIPNYPSQSKSSIQSGLEIGEDSPSFGPYHAWGPDKGTTACPVCKYGRYHGILLFVGNQPQWSDIKKWLAFLEQESLQRGKYLKVYFVYGNENNYDKTSRQRELEKIGTDLKIKNTALTLVPSLRDKESEVYLNKINPQVESTLVIYRNRTIVDNYINLAPTGKNFNLIQSVLNKTKGELFDMPLLSH